MDFLKYWSLEAAPFGRHAAPHFFLGIPQREAIARLNTLINGGLGGGLILAQPGCGLSQLMREMSRSSGFGDIAVQMILTQGGHGGFDAVVAELAVELRGVLGSRCDSLAKVIDAIRTLTRQGVRTVWLADAATGATAEVGRMLIDATRYMSVVLGGRSQQAKSLISSLGHMPLRIELTPLSLDDSVRYVRTTLANVSRGGRQSAAAGIFTDSALVRLHELSEGRIGVLRSIAELSLMIAAHQGKPNVSADLLELVHHELAHAA